MTGPRSATAAGSVRPRVPDVTASIAVHPHTVVACARHVHQAAWPPLPDDRQAAGRTEPGPAPRSRLRRPSAPRRRALARRERGWPHWRRVRTGGRWTEQHLLAGRPEAAAPSSSPGGQAPPTTAERADMARSELLASICPTLWELRTGRRSHVPPWFSSVEPLSWTLRWWSASSNAWTTSQCAGTHSPSAAASRSRGYHATPTGPARSRTTPLAGQFRRSCARRPHRHGLRRGLLRQGLHLGQARATVVPNNTFSTKASTARETS